MSSSNYGITGSGKSTAELFRAEASRAIGAEIERLAALTFPQIRALPEVESRDFVAANREAQLSIYRQIDPPMLHGRVLVTVQIVRHGLGGVETFRVERGLVLSADAAPRDATSQELQASR